MKIFLLLWCTANLYLNPAIAFAQNGDQVIGIAKDFVRVHETLKIPELGYDYKNNFKNIPNPDELDKQIAAYGEFRKSLQKIKSKHLTREGRYLYLELKYVVESDLVRFGLEKKFKNANVTVPDDGIYRIPNHQKWYEFYIRRIATSNIKPRELLDLGHKEVKRVSAEIKKIQTQLGFKNKDAEFYGKLNEASFFYKDVAQVQAAYETLRKEVSQKIRTSFEETAVPEVKIEPMPNPTKDSPPAIYNNKTATFYYNFFNNLYNTRVFDWAFLHEAVPGHHYQYQVHATPPLVPDFTRFAWSAGFTEGWGAYCEDIGGEIGFYSDIYRQLGKWEWDLVRSARLVIDVGIHYQGWSKEQALAYWKNTIPNQDDIAVREIDRITKWPGQVISYKVGEAKVLKLRQIMEKSLGKKFDIKKFHALILSRGSVPLDVLERIVRDGYDL